MDVRGAGDPLTIGERVAFYRRRRGLAQATLAGLVGRSEDWLSKIERGEREIRRLDVLVEVARALRVTLGDLLGEPVLMEDEHKNDDVPAVRDALMAPQRLSKTLFGGGIEPEYVDPKPVAQWAEDAWSEYQGGRIGKVVAVLPRLIKTAQQMESAGGDGAYKRRCAAVSARIHHLAATTLSKVGESDLAWIAAERAMQAADMADDPLVLASAARSGTHALLAVGRFDDALQLGDAAARWLTPRMDEGDPAALSLYGMLHLRSATAAARHQDRGIVNELLTKAETAAESLGVDANHWQTGFGPTNVALHRISTGLDLGDIAQVVEQSGEIDTGAMPVERQVMHLIDYARALSLIARDDDALQVLLSAEERSPQLVRHSAIAREVVRTLYRRAPVTAGKKSSLLLALAERCRAVSEGG
jgi:transcriptional regulator with XRE-family HTH domain